MRSMSASVVVALLLAVCARASDAGDGTSDVVVLTDSSIGAALAANNEKGTVLEFYAPWCGHCKNLAPTYEKVATALKGDVMVAKVDATENKAAAQRFGVKGYPTIVLAKDGKKFDFSGQRTVEALTEFAKNGGTGEGEELEEVDEGEYDGPDEVVKLTDATFEELTQAATGATTGDWVVMFYAPWCGHCKKLHPTFSRVAAELKGDVNVATLDATANTATARRFNVRGYPTVKLFSNGKQYQFEGKRTKKGLIEWATGGFSEADGEDIPAPPNAWEQIWGDVGAEYDMLKKDISTLMRFKKNALIVVFSAGGVVGVLLAFCMFAGLGGLNPPVEYVEQQLEQQQTEPVNGAGDGAGAGAAADSTTPKATEKKKESKKTR